MTTEHEGLVAGDPKTIAWSLLETAAGGKLRYANSPVTAVVAAATIELVVKMLQNASVEAATAIQTLVEALVKCRDQFERYHGEHLRKASAAEHGTGEWSSRLAKATTNREMTEMCDNALASVKQPPQC